MPCIFIIQKSIFKFQNQLNTIHFGLLHFESIANVNNLFKKAL